MINVKGEITNIEDYIATFPDDVQTLLKQMRACIRKAAPQAIERITYRIPTFYCNGNLVHFAAFKNHIGFYPTASGITAFQAQLRQYKSSKGAVQFPLDQPLPLRIIEAIVTYRLQENANKTERLKTPPRARLAPATLQKAKR